MRFQDEKLSAKSSESQGYKFLGRAVKPSAPYPISYFSPKSYARNKEDVINKGIFLESYDPHGSSLNSGGAKFELLLY